MELDSFVPSPSPRLLIAALSLAWLLYRAWKVLKIPVDDLVKILGLEVPLSPQTSLLDLRPTSATVHWKLPEHHSKDIQFAIRINGQFVGELPHLENAATISGLVPGAYYSIRIVAINSANYLALSEPIQIRCPMSEDASIPEQQKPNSSSDHAATTAPIANLSVTPYKALTDGMSYTVAPSLTRESSGSIGQSKRGSVSKPSPKDARPKQRSMPGEKDDAQGVQALTSRLDALRLQLQELQTLDEEEETEYQATQADLIEQRDELKRQLKDRDEQNKDLSKSVKSLEHANSAAQNKKAHQEKALNDKLRSRNKMQEDMARWDSEVAALNEEAEDLKEQQEQLAIDTKKRIAEIKREQKPDLEALSTIEEQIQQKGKEMQDLDKEKKKLEHGPDQPEVNERSRAMAYEEREATERLSALQVQLHEATVALIPLRAYLQQLQQQLDAISMTRDEGYADGLVQNMAHGFEAPIQEAPLGHATSNARVNFNIPETRPTQSYAHARNDTSSTASFRTSSPFHTHPTLTMPPRGINGAGSPDQLMDRLTGGALVSPSANALLPSDLLGDEADIVVKHRTRAGSTGFSAQSSTSRPVSSMSRPISSFSGWQSAQSTQSGGLETDSLPGLGTGLGEEDPANEPSPGASHGSGSPSAFSSPHSSFANLHSHKLSDSNIENDRRSIRSASGSARMQPSSWARFAGFGRQRGSTTSEEGPALGSLKYNQSQSVPRETSDTLPGLASRSTTRGAGGLFGFGRRSAAPDPPADFGAIGTPIRNATSRPESTYSMESSALPEPSEDKPRFGWDVRRNHNSRLASMNPWSPLNSRRQSVHNGSTTSFVPEIEDVEEEEDVTPVKRRSMLPTPIGTKPGKSKSPAPDSLPQLNPAARDFTTMFGFGKKTDKSDKVGNKTKKKEKAADREEPERGDLSYDSSPPDSRKSKDTQPNSFTDSFEDIADEPSTLPNTPQENLTPMSANAKGSLMRRITSKGSSTKFLGLKTKKAAVAEEDGEEDSGSSRLGQSVESIISTPTPTVATPDKRSSTSSFFSSIGRRKKKKPNEAPSLSEASLASETGDEADSRTSLEGTSA